LRLRPSFKLVFIFVVSLALICAAQQPASSNQSSSSPGGDPVTADTLDSSIFLRQQMKPAGPAEQTYAPRVEALIAKMTLREKIGQMTQLQIGMVADGKGQNITINPAKQLGIESRTGSLETGKDADIAIFKNHPLSIYGVPQFTIVDGIVRFDRANDPADMRLMPDPKQNMDEVYFSDKGVDHCMDGTTFLFGDLSGTDKK